MKEKKEKGIGRRLFDETMPIRVTARLDKRHNSILEQIMKENKFSSKSEAIRYLIEDYQTKQK